MLFSPAGGEAVAESVRNTGAILLGRQTHDQGDGLGGFAGSPYAVEHFVVTHRAPERAAKGEMTFTFVTEGVESAVERAKRAAGDRDVAVGAASIAQQRGVGLR